MKKEKKNGMKNIKLNKIIIIIKYLKNNTKNK